jgi:hypothetical protein
LTDFLFLLKYESLAVAELAFDLLYEELIPIALFLK